MAPYFTAATAVAILPKPVSTTTRLSGRTVCKVSTTSRPLPSSSLRSTTAKAGGASLARALPSATDSAIATAKPRASMARASRSRSGRSSSTIRSVFSSVMLSLCPAAGSKIAKALFPAALGGAHITPAPHASICLGAFRGHRRLRPVDHPTRPADFHPGPAARRIAGFNHPSGLFQQDFGDKEAQTHPLMLIERSLGPDLGIAQGMVTGPRGDIGLPNPLKNFRRKTRPVILDGDRKAGGIPARIYLHLALGEIGSVFQNIAQAMQQFRRPPHLRLGRPGRRHLDIDGQIIALKRGGNIFQQGPQRQAGGGTQHRLFRIGQA